MTQPSTMTWETRFDQEIVEPMLSLKIDGESVPLTGMVTPIKDFIRTEKEKSFAEGERRAISKIELLVKPEPGLFVMNFDGKTKTTKITEEGYERITQHSRNVGYNQALADIKSLLSPEGSKEEQV